MWSIGEIKAKGKEAFKANYWRYVLVAFILSLFVGGGTAAGNGSNDTSEIQEQLATISLTDNQLTALLAILVGGLAIAFIIGLLIRIFLTNPIQVGCYRFFKKNVETNDAEIGTIKRSFHSFMDMPTCYSRAY